MSFELVGKLGCDFCNNYLLVGYPLDASEKTAATKEAGWSGGAKGSLIRCSTCIKKDLEAKAQKELEEKRAIRLATRRQELQSISEGLITRKEYMRLERGEKEERDANHNAYYGQFGGDVEERLVEQRFGKELRQGKQPADIELKYWDAAGLFISDTAKRKLTLANGHIDYALDRRFCYSQSDTVCVLKAVAQRMIARGDFNTTKPDNEGG